MNSRRSRQLDEGTDRTERTASGEETVVDDRFRSRSVLKPWDAPPVPSTMLPTVEPAPSEEHTAPGVGGPREVRPAPSPWRFLTRLLGFSDRESTVVAGYDGVQPAPQLTERNLHLPIQPPVRSEPGRRRADLLVQVINQFAVATNRRYDPELKNPCRGHIFAWDFTRAMGTPIPHFIGARELSLEQTCQWVRKEAAKHGWWRARPEEARRVSSRGGPVLVVPRSERTSLIGVVRPPDRSAGDGLRIAAIALGRGGALTLQEAFGVAEVDYFAHA